MGERAALCCVRITTASCGGWSANYLVTDSKIVLDNRPEKRPQSYLIIEWKSAIKRSGKSSLKNVPSDFYIRFFPREGIPKSTLSGIMKDVR